MYAYSADGKRLSKTVNGVTTDFIYSGDTLAGFKRGSDTLMWLYGADGDYVYAEDPETGKIALNALPKFL